MAAGVFFYSVSYVTEVLHSALMLGGFLKALLCKCAACRSHDGTCEYCMM